MTRFQRLQMLWSHSATMRTLRNHSVNVECFLLDVANGKKPGMLLGPQDLREIALYLGDPARNKPECMK